MKIEVTICSFIMRFQKTYRLYALRIVCITVNYFIRQRTSIIYSLEYQTELNLNKNKFLDWNKINIQIIKKYSTQLIRILHTLFKLLLNISKLKEYNSETSLRKFNMRDFNMRYFNIIDFNIKDFNIRDSNIKETSFSQKSCDIYISKKDKD